MDARNKPFYLGKNYEKLDSFTRLYNTIISSVVSYLCITLPYREIRLITLTKSVEGLKDLNYKVR